MVNKVFSAWNYSFVFFFNFSTFQQLLGQEPFRSFVNCHCKSVKNQKDDCEREKNIFYRLNDLCKHVLRYDWFWVNFYRFWNSIKERKLLKDQIKNVFGSKLEVLELIFIWLYVFFIFLVLNNAFYWSFSSGFRMWQVFESFRIRIETWQLFSKRDSENLIIGTLFSLDFSFDKRLLRTGKRRSFRNWVYWGYTIVRKIFWAIFFEVDDKGSGIRSRFSRFRWAVDIFVR